ncbi:hypothetical protein D3C81_1693660 [compost metagenome]
MAPMNQNHELPTIERDTAGGCPRPMRRIAHDCLKMFQSNGICGEAAAARGIQRLAR